MNSAKFEDYRQRLLEEREGLKQRIDNIEEGLDQAMQESLHELSMYDNHPADIGDELFERSKDFALRENAQIQVNKVNRALEKIDSGNYGSCDKCGKEIPEERLDAIPSAVLCMDCKKQEELPDRHPRPIEEDVIVPPFGGRTHDTSERELGDAEDENEFDGEDAWQAVARYGTADSPQDIGNAREYPNIYHDWDEDVGSVDDVDNIAYSRSEEGMIYKDYRSTPTGE